jgi:hypothetical protein
MYLSPATRRHAYLLSRTFVRLAVVAALATALWSSGFFLAERRIITAAHWFADHSGATRASEVWRARGRPAVEHAASTGYQFLRQSAMSVLDYLDISTPTNSAVAKLGKAVERADSTSQQDQRQNSSPQPKRNGRGE